MRALSATLLADQKTASYTPIYKAVFVKGGTTKTYTKAEILDNYHLESDDNYTAVIVVDNAAGTLSSLNLEGYVCTLSYGMDTGSDEYSACAPLTCISQERISWQGRLAVRFVCIGSPNLIQKDKASDDYLLPEDDQKTVKDLLDEILDGTAVAGTAQEKQLSGSDAVKLYSGYFILGGFHRNIPNRTVTKLAFMLKKTGSPTGDIYFVIKEKGLDETVHQRKVLANASTLTGSFVWYEVTWDTPVAIDDNCYIYVEYDGGNSNDYIEIEHNLTPVKNAEYLVLNNGSTWFDYPNYDCKYKYTYTTAGITVYSHCAAYVTQYDSEDALIDVYKPQNTFRIHYNDTRFDKVNELLSFTGCIGRWEADGKFHISVPLSSTTWTSPTGHVDSSSGWDDFGAHPPGDAYDDDTDSYAASDIVTPGNWSEFLELTIASATFNTIRVWALQVGTDLIDVDVYYGAAWNHLYQGTYASLEWVELYGIGSFKSITSVRFRFQNNRPNSAVFALHEVDFGLTYDYEYSRTSGEHGYYNKAKRSRLIMPNKITVESFPDDEGEFSGSATDATSYALRNVDDHIRMKLVDSNQGTTIATAMIAAIVRQSHLGHCLAPINVGQEIHDYVLVTDGTDTVSGNVASIIKRCGGGQQMTIEVEMGIIRPVPIMSAGVAQSRVPRRFSPNDPASKGDIEDIWNSFSDVFKLLEVAGVKIDAIKESIPTEGESYSDIIDGMAPKVTELEADIATNVSDIATNTSDIAGLDLDDIAEGSTYGRVDQAILNSNLIQVGSGTKDSNLSGFHFSETEIVGQLSGADQVIFNTSGQITDANSTVILDVNGLTTKGQKLILQHTDGTLAGWVYGNATQVVLSVTTDKDLRFSTEGSTMDIKHDDDIVITPTSTKRTVIHRVKVTPSLNTSRTEDTTYTNNSGYPILLVVTMDLNGATWADLRIHASTDPPTTVIDFCGHTIAGETITGKLVGIVPAGWKFRVVANDGNAHDYYWNETAIGV